MLVYVEGYAICTRHSVKRRSDPDGHLLIGFGLIKFILFLYISLSLIIASSLGSTLIPSLSSTLSLLFS